MRAELFDETMGAFVSRVPFRPFTVVLVNGNRFEIDHPRAVAYRGGFAMYVAPGNIPVMFDHGEVSEVVGDLMPQAD